MRHGLKKLVKASAFVAGGLLLIVAIVLALALFNKPLVKKVIERYVAGKTGVVLDIGRLDYRLFPLSAVATGVKASYATTVYSVEVTAGRLAVDGDLRKLLAGVRPALNTFAAEITEIRIDQKKVSPTPIDVPALLAGAAGILGYSRRVSLRCGRLVVLLLSQDLRLDDTSLTFDAVGPTGAFRVALACETATGVMDGGRSSVSGGLAGDGSLSLGRSAGVDLRLELVRPRLDLGGKTVSFANATIGLQGNWETDKMILHFPEVALDVPGLASVAGHLDLDGSAASVEAGADINLLDLGALWRAAGPLLPVAPGNFRLEGKAWLEAKYSAKPGAEGRGGYISAKLDTQGIDAAFAGGGRPLAVRLSGTVAADGAPEDPRVSGDIRVESGRLAGMGASVQKCSARLRFTGSKSAARVAIPSATLIGVSTPLPRGATLNFKRVDLSGSSTLHPVPPLTAEADIEARLPGLAPVHLSGRFGARPWRLYRARVATAGQDIAALRGLLAPLLPPALKGWEAGGTIDLSAGVEADGSANAPVRLLAELALSGGKFNDPEFSVASDRLRARLDLTGEYRPGAPGFAGKAALALLGGESLYKHFYISWDKSPLQADVSGRYEPATRSLETLSVTAAVPGLGELNAAGGLELAAPKAFRLKATSRFALEPALAISSAPGPSSGGARISGRVSAGLDISGTAGSLTVKGRLSLAEAAVANPAGVSIPAWSADIPVDLVVPAPSAPAAAAGPGESGTIRFGEVRSAGLTLAIPPLNLECFLNAYEIAPFALDVFGGRLEVGKPVLAVEPAALSLAGSSSLRLAETPLAGLPFAPAGASLTGTVRADFPSVDIAPRKIRASGQAEADIFGGKVVLKNLSVSDPFAAGRAIACELDLVDLDLGKITALVPFGEVTGFIRGAVRGLVIAYGQPEQFTLTLESVKKPGVPRTFSLKAVNSLTIIAAGQPAASPSGSSFWLRSIKGFKYERIGIASTLRNDTFTIDGTILENGVEYLVKRAPLFGISVINRDPGKTIGFKDMMSRLRRIGQSGGPEVR